MLKKTLSSTIIICFFLTTIIPLPKAQGVETPFMASSQLPPPGTMVSLSPAYEPILIKGLTIHKDNPFLFDFIIDTGDIPPSFFKEGDRGSLKQQSNRLIKYFFACLTIPEKDLWVNLSPYEKDRMVPKALGQTALGRDLLGDLRNPTPMRA